MKTEFSLRGDYIELVKLLKATSICESGGEAKQMVEEGLVRVDGEVESRKKRKITVGRIVTVGDHRVDIV